MGESGCGFDLGLRGGRAAEADIVGDRAAEDHGFRRNQRDFFPEPFGVECAKRSSVETDFSLIRFV